MNKITDRGYKDFDLVIVVCEKKTWKSGLLHQNK